MDFLDGVWGAPYGNLFLASSIVIFFISIIGRIQDKELSESEKRNLKYFSAFLFALWLAVVPIPGLFSWHAQMQGKSAELNLSREAEPKDVESLIRDFRQSLLNWDEVEGTNARGENRPPQMNALDKENLTRLIKQIAEGVEDLQPGDLLHARAKFYISYWPDFQQRVLSETTISTDKGDVVVENGEKCMVASAVYSESIDSYLLSFSNNKKVLKAEDFFIVIELGHWLMNRDAGPYDYLDDISSNYNGYKTALELYKGLADVWKSNKFDFGDYDSPEERQVFPYNFYASRGLANAKLEELEAAKLDFREARNISDKSSDFQYNFASIFAQNGQFIKSESEYKIALEKYASTEARVGIEIIRRDLGWSYLLQGVDNLEPGAEADYKHPLEAAIREFDLVERRSQERIFKADVSEDEKANLEGLIRTAHVGKALAIHYLGNSYAGELTKESELVKAGSFCSPQNYICNTIKEEIPGEDISLKVRKIAFGNIVPHDLGADKVLDVFHKAFYCKGSSKRTT